MSKHLSETNRRGCTGLRPGSGPLAIQAKRQRNHSTAHECAAPAQEIQHLRDGEDDEPSPQQYGASINALGEMQRGSTEAGYRVSRAGGKTSACSKSGDGLEED
jgi:hypothetical protein